jgi:hypothetical protein
MENMLRPLIESLGYRVVAMREGVEADIVIAGEGDRLQIGEDAIHRYDRAALLGALTRERERANG